MACSCRRGEGEVLNHDLLGLQSGSLQNKQQPLHTHLLQPSTQLSPLTILQSSHSPTTKCKMPFRNECSIEIAAPPAKVREVVRQDETWIEINKTPLTTRFLSYSTSQHTRNGTLISSEGWRFKSKTRPRSHSSPATKSSAMSRDSSSWPRSRLVQFSPFDTLYLMNRIHSGKLRGRVLMARTASLHHRRSP